jgi:hypothetical protein
VPATALRGHSDWALYLDSGSAANLEDALLDELSVQTV